MSVTAHFTDGSHWYRKLREVNCTQLNWARAQKLHLICIKCTTHKKSHFLLFHFFSKKNGLFSEPTTYENQFIRYCQAKAQLQVQSPCPNKSQVTNKSSKEGSRLRLTLLSIALLMRNITVKCRAMKDFFLCSVNIFRNYPVLGLFKCIFRKPRNFLCNMKLGSRVIGQWQWVARSAWHSVFAQNAVAETKVQRPATIA